MQERDVSTITYLEDKRRCADLLNVYAFHGEQIVQAENIQEINRSVSATRKQGKKNMSLVVFRDLVRKIQLEMKVLLVAIENQNAIDYAMVLRAMLGNSFSYYRQYREIAKRHAEEKDLKGAEYLSKFAVTDRLIPEWTLVLYWGEEPWTGPRSLKEMLDLSGLPKEICDLIEDYRIHVLEVRRFKDYEKFKTDLKQVFGFLQRTSDKKALRDYIKQEKEAFSELSEDAFDLLEAFTCVTKVKAARKVRKQEGENGMSRNMCKAIEDMILEGEARGEARGEAKGEAKGEARGMKWFVETLQEFGVSVEEAITKVQKKCNVERVKAQEYVEKFWV